MLVLEMLQPAAIVRVQARQDIGRQLPFGGNLLQPGDRRLNGQPASLDLLPPLPVPLAIARIHEPEGPDDGGQQQTLPDEGDDDNRIGQEQDLIAVGERLAIRRDQRNCQRRGQ